MIARENLKIFSDFINKIMLLSITFLILINSLSFDDILGQTFAIYIIAIAGAESAVGLGILVAFYRLRGTIAIDHRSVAFNSYNTTPISSKKRGVSVEKIGVRKFSSLHSTGGMNKARNIQTTTDNRLSRSIAIEYK